MVVVSNLKDANCLAKVELETNNSNLIDISSTHLVNIRSHLEQIHREPP